MPTDCEIQLSEARLALHKLMTGGQAVEVNHGDQKIRFTEINRPDLEAYIQKLENQCGGTAGAPKRRAPLGVIFGG